MKTKTGNIFFCLLLPTLAIAQNITVNGTPLEYPVGIQGAVELEFLTDVGEWYQVQISPDLDAWDNEGYSIKGTGGLVSTVVSTRQYGTAFYRVSDGALPENSAPWPVYTGIAPVSIDETYQIGLNPATAGYILKSTGSGWVAGPPNPTSSAVLNNMQPSLGINYIIALVGVFPSRSSIYDPTIAEIMMFGGNFAPRNWAFCNGLLLPISSYSALFSILGTAYGGDGITTFALPDLRGRVPVQPGTGPGLSTRNLGQQFGTETTTHNH